MTFGDGLLHHRTAMSTAGAPLTTATVLRAAGVGHTSLDLTVTSVRAITMGTGRVR